MQKHLASYSNLVIMDMLVAIIDTPSASDDNLSIDLTLFYNEGQQRWSDLVEDA